MQDKHGCPILTVQTHINTRCVRVPYLRMWYIVICLEYPRCIWTDRQKHAHKNGRSERETTVRLSACPLVSPQHYLWWPIDINATEDVVWSSRTWNKTMLYLLCWSNNHKCRFVGLVTKLGDFSRLLWPFW